MSEFIQPTQKFFLTDPVQNPKPKASFSTYKSNVEDLKFNTGLSTEELSKIINESGNPLQPVTYKEVGASGLSTRLESGASLDVLQNQANKEIEVNSALRKMEVLSAVDVATANDDATSAVAWKTQKRIASLQNRIMDHVESSNGGVVDTVVEFVDQLAYSTYAGIRDIKQGFTGGGTETGAESREIWTAARTMTDDEYRIWEQTYVDNMASKGLLENVGGTSGWAGAQALQAVDGAGFILYDKEWGYVSSAGAVVDVTTLGLGGVSKVAKVGRSLVGRLRNTAGTLKATEAAESTALVLRSGLDGEIVEDLAIADARTVKTASQTSSFSGRVKNIKAVEEAEIVDDIIPEAYASKLKPTVAPPVSFGRIKSTVSKNTLISKFLTRESKQSFGVSNISDTAQTWAMAQATKLAEASSTKLINFDFVHEGLQNYKTSVTFGRSDGMPFKSFDTAQKELSKFPNSVILDTRTNKVVTADTGSGQFVIQSETRVPYYEAVGAMDITEPAVKNAISGVLKKVQSSRVGRFFSAAHYNTSSYLSNLADAAEFGHLAYHKDIENAFKEVNKLNGLELENVNKVLTTLRDTPPTKGSTKRWLSLTDFIQNYTALAGKAPSLQAIKAYEHIVDMSDFSWYSMASDRLRALASQNASIVKMNSGVSHVVYPTSRTVKSIKDSGIQTWAHDLSTGKRVSVNGLDENQGIMSFGHRQSDYSDYVINFEGKVKLPTLEDAFPYNAGGPRTNPDLRYFVGDTTNGWATLIGARTEKEATTAVSQFNKIAEELRKVFGDTIPDNASASLSKLEKDRINNVIRSNSDWNTSIEDIDDLIKFTKDRGVNPLKNIFSKERNAKLATFSKLGDGINDSHVLDMSVEKYTSYSRHDIVLREFGGDLTSNPDPVLAVANQFNSMINRAAQTQYRMEATSSWVKAVEKAAENGDISQPTVGLRPTTDEGKVRSFVIEGNTKAAIKLRNEQDVILRRLNMYDGFAPQFADGVDKINGSAFETIYNKNKTLGSIYQNYVGKSVDNASSTLMSLGFFQKMADPSQLIMQGAHIVTIASISPVNGSKGVVLAGFIRQAARESNPAIWSAIESKLAKFADLTPEQNKALLEHIFDSGRGYMRGAIVEDTADAVTPKGILAKIGNIIRVPYYAGENFQSTASRITAYLDTVKKYPDLDTKSSKFLNEVQARDRTISFGMNSAQKSLAQSGPISKVLTQWSAFPIRALETIFFGDLTVAEKTRFVGIQALMFGFAGLGLYSVGEKLSEVFPDEMRDFIIKGVGDTMLSETVGIELGGRIGLNFVSLMERASSVFVDNGQSPVPAFKIAGDTAGSTLSAIMNFGTGRWDMMSHDLETLVRAWKIIDNPVMAYEMMMNDVRRTRTGSITEGPFTTSQEVFQALGFSPSQAIDEQNIRNLTFDIKKKQKVAIDKALPYTKEAFDLIQNGNLAAGVSLLKDVDAVLQGYGLSGVSLREAKDEIFNKTKFDSTETMIKTLMLAGYLEAAKEIAGE